ncbi:ABC transporter substrate-binding protein [Acidovorax cavernicola]|uniref:ABC transporter substrate-binding protein n=1 Tax=Acidovorax cavernicola TaxID=1675792 RepID=A0A9X8D627_9BURK|nr:ABC transporter substrate-binding protein [Acidovorax cavernicola]
MRPLRIGVIGSWSGPYAGGGRQFDAGMAVWLADHKQQIAGRPVELLRRDVPGSAPEQARRQAQDLIESERVDLLTGLDFSSNAYAVGTVATQARVPTVIMNAASSGITGRSPFMVRVSFTIPQVTAPLARWALQQGLRDVCTVVADYASGVDAESAFVSGITAGGGRVGAMLRVPLNTLDYSAYMLRLRELKPQAVFFFLPSGQMPAIFLKFWRDRGMADTGIRLLATGDATDDHYLDGIGELAEGLVTSHHYSYAHESPANRRFAGAFETEYGSHLRPGYFAVAAHDALAAIDAALSAPGVRGGKAGAERLVDAFRGLRLDSPRGPVEIDAHTRDVVQSVYIRRVERRDARWINREFECTARVRDAGVA